MFCSTDVKRVSKSEQLQSEFFGQVSRQIQILVTHSFFLYH
jgi:hypothetical protein